MTTYGEGEPISFYGKGELKTRFGPTSGVVGSSVVTAWEFKSVEPAGFDPLGEPGQFFCPSESTLVPETCLCLTPLAVYSTHSTLS